MRIGINCCGLVEHSGGLRQYFSRLLHGLRRDPRNEYRLFWTARNRTSLDALLDSGWGRDGSQVTSEKAITPLLRDLDLYFCPTGMLYPRPVPIASVVMVPDIQEHYFPRFFSAREQWSRLYHHGVSMQQADRVLTLSKFCRDGIGALYGIPSAKTLVTPLAADDSLSAAAVAPLPDGLPDRFFLYPANFWLHKNHERLLRALADARDRQQTRIACVLTGARVPHGYDVEAGLSRYGLTDQVQVLGYQSERTMHALYRRATALVFPSLHEGFGLPLVEAMSAGCPIACSTSTSIPEVAGDAAAFFDAQKPTSIAAVLLQVWEDGALRATLAEKGRARAHLFSSEVMIRVHQQAFEEAHQAYARDRRGGWQGRELRHLFTAGLQVLRSRVAARSSG